MEEEYNKLPYHLELRQEQHVLITTGACLVPSQILVVGGWGFWGIKKQMTVIFISLPVSFLPLYSPVPFIAL